MKKLIILIISFAMFMTAKAQESPVEIGQFVPDLPLGRGVNADYTNKHLSDYYRQGLLVIDFWATWCAPCVSLLPKSKELEKEFDGKLKVLSVSKEDYNKVSSFLKKMKISTGIEISSVVEDTRLSKIFPHRLIPHLVWIDSNGRVLSITSGDELTRTNVERALEGKPARSNRANMVQKKNIDYRRGLYSIGLKEILQDGSINKQTAEIIDSSQVLSYSIASRYQPNAPNEFRYNDRKITFGNIGLSLLYRYFYELSYYGEPKYGAFSPDINKSFEFENKDILAKVTMPNMESSTRQEIIEWGDENSVCFEMLYDERLPWSERMAQVKHELVRYFEKPIGFTTYVEQRLDSNVYVLKRIREVEKKKIIAKEPVRKHDRYSYMQEGIPISNFFNLLRGYYFQSQKITFLADIPLEEVIDLDLVCTMTDIKAINKELDKYGLSFVKEARMIDVLVFTDRISK